MAQFNITLDQEEILQLLAGDRNEAFRTLLQNSLNSLLKVESAQQLQAAPYERTSERTDSRNGSRTRELTTRIGTIELAVPRHRNEPFKTMIFDNYKRSESALISTMAEMVVKGVSTRKVGAVMEELCGKSFSKSSVSELCKALDQEVQDFRNRPLKAPYPFLYVDATYFKVHEDRRVTSKALMIAIAYNEDGRREVLGFHTYEKEARETWTDFLLGLKNRGLHGVLTITSDAHEGIQYGIREVFPEIPWQRCQYHFTKNIVGSAPKSYQAGLRAELQEMFQCTDLGSAQEKRDSILNDYREVAGKSMECLENGFNDAMTILALPESLRKMMRTSNYLERVNKELKRRSNVIGIFPNEDSIVRLMGSVLMEWHQKEAGKKPVFYRPRLTEARKKQDALRELALQQQNMRRAC